MNLRILFVEDSPDDVELLLRRLREAGIESRWERVATEAALREALAGEPWDVALVDFNLPGFGGPRALAVLAAAAPDLPAITVSGAISEETAVATITAGAVDYVLKDNLTRLAPAVRRAVEGAELRREQRRAAEHARQTMYAIEHSSQAIIYVSEDGTLLYANAAAQGLGGVPPAAAVGMKLWSWTPLVGERRWSELWRAALQAPAVDFEATLRLPGGEERVVSATLDHHESDHGSFVIVYARDVTERRREEKELRFSKFVVEEAADSVFWMTADGAFTYANPTTCAILGYSLDELCAMTIHDIDPAFPAERWPQHMRELEEAGSLTFETLHRSKNGTLIPMEITANYLEYDGAVFNIAFARDIRERKQAERALLRSEERFRLFAEYLPGLLTIKDAELRYIFGNNARTAERRIPSPQWIGKTPEELWSKEEALATRETGARVLAGEVVEEVSETSSEDGKAYWRSVHFPIPQGESPPLVGGFSIDVTEQVEAQDEVLRQAEQLRRTVEGAVLAMSNVVETRDPYTAGHERRVSELATAIAAELGMDGAQLDGLRLAGLIHDIGKIAVPAEILAKPGRLSEVEFNLIKQHPESGHGILGAIDFERPVAEMVLQHHERLDGSGYPRGLAGEQVMPEARILAVADVVEAMSSHRPYRAALGMAAALAEVREHAGVKYDEHVVAACVRLVEEQGFVFTP